MIIFIKLLLAHLIGDFVLQPKRWLIHKEVNKIRSWFLHVHIGIHFGLVLLVLWDWTFWKLALIIALTHYLIDLAKLYTESYFRNKSIPFFIDQILHISVLYGCAFYKDLGGTSSAILANIDWPLLTAVVFVTMPAAIVMSILLQKMSDQIELDHKSLPNAGKYIGIIERIFVLIFIIMDRWEAIGLLIAAKSVFRFNDLKESNSRKLTEYILIGTLLSFGIAIVTGLIYTIYG